MGRATTAICQLIDKAVLHGWSATFRLVVVMLVVGAVLWLLATTSPAEGLKSSLIHPVQFLGTA